MAALSSVGDGELGPFIRRPPGGDGARQNGSRACDARQVAFRGPFWDATAPVCDMQGLTWAGVYRQSDLRRQLTRAERFPGFLVGGLIGRHASALAARRSIVDPMGAVEQHDSTIEDDRTVQRSAYQNRSSRRARIETARTGLRLSSRRASDHYVGTGARGPETRIWLERSSQEGAGCRPRFSLQYRRPPSLSSVLRA